jgi:hypothetical protein
MYLPPADSGAVCGQAASNLQISIAVFVRTVAILAEASQPKLFFLGCVVLICIMVALPLPHIHFSAALTR